jgi:uncharacterized protein DUF5681
MTTDAPPPAAPPANIRSKGGRFQKGQRSANPRGKPRGTRSRKTIIAAKMLENIDTEAILKKMEKQAKKGSESAAKIILDRTLPIRRGCPIIIELPRIETTAAAVQAVADTIAQMAAGKITPTEANEVIATINAAREVIRQEVLQKEMREFEKQVLDLKAATS